MKKIIIFDLLFYVVLPYLIWNQGKELIGDYYAMLFSTVPGIIYTLVRFFIEKQFNITGLFIITSLTVNTIIDIWSGNAEAMLKNGVYYTFGLGAFFLLTVLIKKPLSLYFFIDVAALMGHDRKESLELYKTKRIFSLFQYLTLLLVVRSICQGFVKIWLINKYGVEGYDEMIIYMQAIGWTFSILIGGFTVYIGSMINKQLESSEEEESETKTLNH